MKIGLMIKYLIRRYNKKLPNKASCFACMCFWHHAPRLHARGRAVKESYESLTETICSVGL
jgi:hypothetical protein